MCDPCLPMSLSRTKNESNMAADLLSKKDPLSKPTYSETYTVGL